MILSQLSLLGSWRKLLLLNDGHFGFPNIWEHYVPVVILYLVDTKIIMDNAFQVIICSDSKASNVQAAEKWIDNKWVIGGVKNLVIRRLHHFQVNCFWF